jgi:hypothetical protein
VGRRRPRRSKRRRSRRTALRWSVVARAGCTRTCPVGRAAGDVLRVVLPPQVPSRRHLAHRRGASDTAACLRCRLSGRSSDKYQSPWIQGPSNRSNWYRVLRPTSYGAWGGRSPMLRNDADVFRSGVISLEAGMKFRSPHPVGGEVADRHGGRVSPVLGHTAARVEPCCSVSAWRPR